MAVLLVHTQRFSKENDKIILRLNQVKRYVKIALLL